MHSIQEPPASTKRYNFPVKGCMLFGVPNRGSDVANTASGILKLLNTVFNVNRNMVQDLEKKSQRLANIASQFRQVRHEHNIPVISFFEQQKYGSGLGLVSDEPSGPIGKRCSECKMESTTTWITGRMADFDLDCR